MTKLQYESLLNICMQSDHHYLLNSPVAFSKKLHIYLYFVGNNPYNTEMVDRFGVGSPLTYVLEVANLLNESLYNNFVKWPDLTEKVAIKQQFEQYCGFKNIIGCIDGTHVGISGIGKFRNGYTTRKSVYAINVTFVCDYNKQIRYSIIGCPGAYHDNRVFELCDLHNNESQYFDGNDVMLGDSAYKGSNNVVVPYTSPSVKENVSFNYLHAKARVKVENTIGLNKGKFKVMGTQIRIKSIRKIVIIIKSITVVHNFIIQYSLRNNTEDVWEEDELHENDLQVVEQYPEHAAINYRFNVSAFERKEIMKRTNE
eukprot:NODE_61_length_26588_cov_1.146778.p7 type:complete len:313 gc:universal NODE_61_length_26588_cov_1.146778:16053-16991(+)